jgi:hypothetical protein
MHKIIDFVIVSTTPLIFIQVVLLGVAEQAACLALSTRFTLPSINHNVRNTPPPPQQHASTPGTKRGKISYVITIIII